MLSSKIDALLAFQPPKKELLQQKDIHTIAKKYYDFFGFTDNALVFLKRYITENFSFLNYFDQSSVLLIQTCHNFQAAWPKLHQDPSPLISVLFLHLQNTLSLTSSLSPLDFKVEEEARETFAMKVNAIKDIQQAIDKKFQTLWKQSHVQTTAYYQKLEEYKEEKGKVREEYEEYEKQTRDSKGYNVTLVRELEAKLSEKVLSLTKTKEAFESVCFESQETYNAILKFFDENKGVIEEFLKLFLNILSEMTVFLIERMQQNFMFLRQATSEAVQSVKRQKLKGSFEAEENFMKEFSQNQKHQIGQIKEMNRLNYHRQEFVNAMGFLSQQCLHLCQDALEKFVYFEEIDTFKTFFSQFDSKISLNLLPFADFLSELKSNLIVLFNAEKNNNERIVQKLVSQRFKAYSSLINTLSGSSKKSSQQPNQIDLETSFSVNGHSKESIKKAFSEFLQVEDDLAQEFAKDIERLYTSMNQELWTKLVQTCQKLSFGFKEKMKEDKLIEEVHRIQNNLIQALGNTENIETLESKRNLRKISTARDRAGSLTEDAVVADEGLGTNSNKLNKYNQNGFKFIKEKKAESLADYIKRQNDERLKEINPNPYTVEFDKGTVSFSTHSDEAVLDSFACAFVEKMLLQGRMYITSTKIVFKSYFNGRTLFGSTVLFIPLREIINVAKKKNMLGIENMIEITTRKGDLLFTSFVFRDTAFDLIQKVLKTVHPGYARNLNRGQLIPMCGEAFEEELEENTPVEAMCPGESAANKKLKKQQKIEREYQKRTKDLFKTMPPVSKYDQLGYKYQYPVDLNTFFRVFLCKSPVAYRGKEYSCCWEIFEEEQGTSELQVEEWSQDLPKNIMRKKDLIPFTGCLERNCKGKKNLNIPIPFVPKSFMFVQQNKLFLINQKEIVMILEVDAAEKIPLSDTFKFRTCYVIKDETGPDGKPSVSMSFNYYVDWFKTTLLKNILLKAAKEEITGTGVKINKVITDLLNDGVFEKKRKELEAEDQVEESAEEDNLEEANIVEDVFNNDCVDESQKPDEIEIIKEDERVVQDQINVNNQVSEFKVSKQILFIYFSVSLVLFSFIFIRHLLG